MRILMAAHTFLPETRGGMENHAYHLARYLLSQDHEVGMLYRFRDRELEEYRLFEEEWEGIQVFKFVRNYSNPMPTPFRFYDRQVEVLFEGILDRYRPDLFHVHHLADLSTSLPAAARRHGVPTIHTLHDYWPMCFMSHLRTPDGIVCPGPDEGIRCVECWWKRQLGTYAPVNIKTRFRELGTWESLRRAPRFAADWFFAKVTASGRAEASRANLRTEMVALAARNGYMRKALTDCDLLISPSRFLADQFIEWGVPADLFQQVYNSVPTFLRELRVPEHRVKEPIDFAFIGTLYPPKGAHILVEAFQRLNSKRAVLHIWGGAPNVSVKEYAEELYRQGESVPNLIFEGSFPPEKLPEVLQDTDVLVVPSIWYENNPLVILEAFAAGIPVVAGDAGGMAELVEHDVNGLLFSMGDPHDLAEKLEMMLDLDRVERHRTSVTPPWSHDEMGAEVERIYASLLA